MEPYCKAYYWDSVFFVCQIKQSKKLRKMLSFRLKSSNAICWLLLKYKGSNSPGLNQSVLCFVQATEDAENEIPNTVMGIYKIRRGDCTEDIGVVIEGVKVLSNLDCVILAFIMLFGLIYALDLSFPDNLKYTFEFIQKILMNLEGHRLNAKIQQLKIKLFAWDVHFFWEHNENYLRIHTHHTTHTKNAHTPHTQKSTCPFYTFLHAFSYTLFVYF